MQIKEKIVSCHTADSKLFKQEVNRTVILPPLVFPGKMLIVQPSGALWYRSVYPVSVLVYSLKILSRARGESDPADDKTRVQQTDFFWLPL